MPTEFQNEIRDLGRGVDKPKGFVKLALIGMATAIVGLSGFVTYLIRDNAKAAGRCSDKVEQIMIAHQKIVYDLQAEYNRKLEERMSRLEHVEQRVDSLPQNKVR